MCTSTATTSTRRRVPPHLRMNVLVLDDYGKARDADTDLTAIRARLATDGREAIADALPLAERTGITTWDRRDVAADRRGRGIDGHRVVGYPALLDDDDSVSLRIVTTRDLQRRVMRGGVRRLLLLTAAPSVGDAARRLDDDARLAIAASGIYSRRPRRRLPVRRRRRSARRCRAAMGRGRVRRAAGRGARHEAGRSPRRRSPAPPACSSPPASVRRRLERLVAESVALVRRRRQRPPRPARRTPLRDRRRRRPDRRTSMRYVEGIAYRLDRLADDVARDVRRMSEVVPLERRYGAYLRRARAVPPERRGSRGALAARGAADECVRPAARRRRAGQRATGRRTPHRPRRLTPTLLDLGKIRVERLTQIFPRWA